MAEQSAWRGVGMVALGAMSYGVLATIVKLAYLKGFSTESVTFAQFSIGVFVLGMMWFLGNRKSLQNPVEPKPYSSLIRLIVFGTTTGMTGLFYYRAVQFIPVSLCIVLLMQSVWMGVLLDAILLRKMPSSRKVVSMLMVLAGTVLATNMYMDIRQLHPNGLFWGVLAALAYTLSVFASNRVATHLPNTKRSFYMILGGWLFVVGLLLIEKRDIEWNAFWPWGIYLALFGTVLPPLFLNKGIPLTGVGLGSIILSLEIPVSVSMAFFILGERFSPVQWVGVGLIMVSIFYLNFPLLSHRFRKP
jgi:drug/metabolite transporter (DMT)-like permease